MNRNGQKKGPAAEDKPFGKTAVTQYARTGNYPFTAPARTPRRMCFWQTR